VSANHLRLCGAGQSTKGKAATPSAKPTARIITMLSARSPDDFTIAFQTGWTMAERITRP